MKFDDGTTLRLRPAQLVPVVSVMPGLGAHRLAVRLDIERVHLAESVTHITVSGELRADAGRGWIGSFLPTPLALRTKAHTVSAELVIPVTSAQLLALEEHRAGADLTVLADLQGALPQSAAHPFTQVQYRLQMPASDWEKQLEQAGVAASFTVSIPLPMAQGGLRTAAGHLRGADRQITAGEYPDAIRQTRLALTAMRQLAIWPTQVAKKRNDQNQDDRYGILLDQLHAQADAYAALIQGAFNQASGPQHNDGAIASARWLRPDAIALNAMAAALLHRLAADIS